MADTTDGGPANTSTEAVELEVVIDDTDEAEPVVDPPSVFISYRRADTGDVVPKLAGRLRDDLGSRNVFRDKEDILVGERWQERLVESMRAADAAVILIGEEWAGVRADGTRRIDETDDPVRNEVIQALARDERAAPLPFLVDCEDPPGDLDAEVSELFDDHHYVTVTRRSLDLEHSVEYQGILVGVWNALRMRVPNGVLIVGDRNAMASLDALVHKLKEAGAIDARNLSRFASGAYVVSVRKERKQLEKWSDVIINVDDEEPSPLMRARVAAVAALPGLARATIVGAGAAGTYAAVSSITSTSASTATFSQATAGQLVAGLTPAAGGGSGLAAMGLGAKLAIAAAATAAAVAVGVGVSNIGSDDAAVFAAVTELSPIVADETAFPFGTPEPATVRLGDPVPVDDEEAQAYFGNFPGGLAERRTVEVDYGDRTVSLGDVVVPVEYPGDFIDRNIGTFRLTQVRSDGELAFVEDGVGAAAPCVYDGTGDTVGGWTYTGEPGDIVLTFLFESDGETVTGVGVTLSFDAPADVEFFDDVVAEVIPPDVDVTDRCTPLDRTRTGWGSGVGLSE